MTIVQIENEGCFYHVEIDDPTHAYLTLNGCRRGWALHSQQFPEWAMKKLQSMGFADSRKYFINLEN